MRKIQRLSKKGNGLVVFAALSTLVIGMISASVFVGSRVTKSLDTQIAADAAAKSMAMYSSQGLNGIAVNNVGIGTGIHIANSANILAAYLGLIKACLTGCFDSLDNNEIIKLWQGVGKVVVVFHNSSVGLTRYNTILRNTWLAPAPLMGVELGRENAPGSIVLPYEDVATLPFKGKTGLAMAFGSPVENVLAITSPMNTMCQVSHAASDTISEDWSEGLKGPISTLVGSGFGDAVSAVSGVLNTITKISPLKFRFGVCGMGSNLPLDEVADVNGRPRGPDSKPGGKEDEIMIALGNYLKENLTARNLRWRDDSSCTAKLPTFYSEFDKGDVDGTLQTFIEAYDMIRNQNSTMPVMKTPLPAECQSDLDRPECNDNFHVDENFPMCALAPTLSTIATRPNIYGTTLPDVTCAIAINSYASDSDRCRNYNAYKDAKKRASDAYKNSDAVRAAPFLNWAKQMRHSYPSSSGESILGFTFINPRFMPDLKATTLSAAQDPRYYREFNCRTSFRVFMLDPVWNARDFEGSTDACSNWKVDATGSSNPRCEMLMTTGFASLIGGSSPETAPDDRRIMTGGVSELAAHPTILNRFQFSMGRYRSVYLPAPSDPVPPMPSMRLMWPAWSSSPDLVLPSEFFSNRSTCLDHDRTSTRTPRFLTVIDTITGHGVERPQ